MQQSTMFIHWLGTFTDQTCKVSINSWINTDFTFQIQLTLIDSRTCNRKMCSKWMYTHRITNHYVENQPRRTVTVPRSTNNQFVPFNGRNKFIIGGVGRQNDRSSPLWIDVCASVTNIERIGSRCMASWLHLHTSITRTFGKMGFLLKIGCVASCVSFAGYTVTT